MKQFEIKSHDGPGRYGKLGDLETPAIINKNDFSIADDESSAYDVEKEIAQWSVNQTIEKAKLVEDKEIAVIQGSKYIDLRIKCLKELEELGYNGFIIANADDLLLHPGGNGPVREHPHFIALVDEDPSEIQSQVPVRRISVIQDLRIQEMRCHRNIPLVNRKPAEPNRV